MNQRTGRVWAAMAAAAVMVAVAAGCSKAPDTVPSLATAPGLGTASAPVANVPDVDVTEHVKTALQRDDALKGFNITVVTINGDVRLNGVVDTQAQVADVIRIARMAEGAHSIHDELTVKP